MDYKIIRQRDYYEVRSTSGAFVCACDTYAEAEEEIAERAA